MDNNFKNKFVNSENRSYNDENLKWGPILFQMIVGAVFGYLVWTYFGIEWSFLGIIIGALLGSITGYITKDFKGTGGVIFGCIQSIIGISSGGVSAAYIMGYLSYINGFNLLMKFLGNIVGLFIGLLTVILFIISISLLYTPRELSDWD